MIQHQMTTAPEFNPDYLMIDGNGIWHPRKCGLACHIGVGVNLPTIGVAKNIFCLNAYYYDNMEPKEYRDKIKIEENEKLVKSGDFLDFTHPEDSCIVGSALKIKENSRPCYVSIGHKISLAKSREISLRTSNYKIPEPTRQADLLGREYIRNTFGACEVAKDKSEEKDTSST